MGKNAKALPPLIIGADVGGTKLGVALVDEGGHVLRSNSQPTPVREGPDKVIGALVRCIRECMEGSPSPVAGVGVGMAAQVDRATGAVRSSPNLGWRDVPLRARLEAALGLPVMVTNDVRAATWGEFTYGAGRGMNDMACFFVGTGVGGGIVLGGRLLEGSSNTAGELGHLTVVAGGRRCTCGGSGCLEAYAGGWAIAQRAQEAVRGDHQAGQGLLAIAGAVQLISAATVGAAYAQDDPLAQQLMEEAGRYLGAGAVSVVNALNPQLIVLGGGVVEGVPMLVDVVEEYVRVYALQAALDELRTVKAALGGVAGAIGAAALARAAFEKRA